MMRAALAAAITSATLGGCAGGVQSVYTSGLWVSPGKYDFIKCPDIAQRTAGLTQQEAKLVSQMQRADQDPAGPVINLMVYQAQLEQTRADLDLLRQTAREKDCKNTVPTANAATPASSPPPAPTRRH